MKPARGDWSRIERNLPRQRADLSPNIPNLTSYRFCDGEVLRAVARVAPKKERQDTQARGGAAAFSE
jgi:hypothetical protein